MALTKTQVSELYVAIFNRASEGEGNEYWQEPFVGATVEDIANGMLETTDAQEYFGDSLDDDQAFIEHIYQNTLNKTIADDPEGIAFWTDALATYSRGYVVAELVAAVAQYADSTDPVTQVAYNQFVNRVAVSDYTADTLATAPEDYATSLNFGADLVVTDDAATVTAAEAAVDLIANPPTGETFTLTPGTDEYVGTTGDDTFNAEIGTFTNNTDIDGLEGQDTLNAEYASNLSTGPTLANVEVVNLTNLSGGVREINTVNFTGVEEIWSVESVGEVKLDNVASVDTVLGLKDTDADLTVRYASDALGAASDEDTNVNVVLSGADGSNISVGPQSLLAAGRINSITLNSQDVANEIGTITDSAITDKSLETVVVTGDQDLEIGGFAADVETIDASALEANLEVSVGDLLTDDLTVLGGTGGDNTVAANVTEDAAATLTDIQNLELNFSDGKVFDAENTNTAAAYTVKGTSANVANIISGSTFTVASLTAGTAASSFDFLGLGDFDLTVTNSTGAVDFGGIDFTNVRDVIVNTSNKAATTLGAVDLGDLGRSVTVESSSTVGNNTTVGAITVGADNVFAQTLTATAKAAGHVTFNDYTTAQGALSATLTADDEGDVAVNDLSAYNALTLTMAANDEGDVTANDATSSMGGVTATMTAADAGDVTANDLTGRSNVVVTANAESTGDVTVNDVLSQRGSATVDLVAANKGDVTVNNVTAYSAGGTSGYGSTATVTATTGLAEGGDISVGAITGRTDVTVTGSAAQETNIDFGAIKSESGSAGNITVDLSTADGTSLLNTGSVIVGGAVDATGATTGGNIDITLDAGAYSETSIGGAVTTTKGAVTVTATAGRMAEAFVGTSAAPGLGDAITAANITATTDVTVNLTTVAGTSATVKGGIVEVGDVATTEGTATLNLTNGARGTLTVGDTDIATEGNVDFTLSNASNATATVGELVTAKGDVSAAITNSGTATVANTAVNDISTADGAVTLDVTAGKNSTTTLGDITATDAAVVTVGTNVSGTDTFTALTIGDVTADSITLTSTARSAGKTVTVGDLDASGAAAGSGVTITAELSGTANVTLGTLIAAGASNSTLINAENLTGVLTVTGSNIDDFIVGGAGADQITLGTGGDDEVYGGAGNDAFFIDSLTITVGDSVIDGGAGTDSLSINGGAAIDLTGVEISSIETLNVTATEDVTLTAAQLDAFTTVNVAAGAAITVEDLDGESVAATGGDDTFEILAGDSGVVISNFTTAADAAGFAEGTDLLRFSDADLTALTGFADATASLGTKLTLNDGSTVVEFVSGAGAQTATGAYAAFLFNETTGELSFDADGTGAEAAVDILTLTGVADLAAADFAFVA